MRTLTRFKAETDDGDTLLVRTERDGSDLLFFRDDTGAILHRIEAGQFVLDAIRAAFLGDDGFSDWGGELLPGCFPVDPDWLDALVRALVDDGQ